MIIQLDALPGKMGHGTVANLGPVGTVMQGVVNFPVVSIENPDREIRPGMTANLVVEVARRANVLLLPTRAIRAQGNQKLVSVDDKGQTI